MNLEILNLRPGIVLLLSIAGAFLVAVVLNLVIGKLGRRAAERQKSRQLSAGESASSSWTIRQLVIEWLIKGIRTAVWSLYFLFILAVMPHTQESFEGVGSKLQKRLNVLDNWLVERGVTAALVIIVTVFLMRFAGAFVRTSFEVYETRQTAAGNVSLVRRARTLSAILRGIAQTAIFFVGAMVALQQAGLNITPILASAGIIGLAIGFGAQSLIKDIFSGFLILFEDQYAVGDTIKIGEVAGTVEDLSLRSTRVRGVDGALTVFPNGNITTVSNLSKDWLRLVVDYDIDYTADTDRALQIAGGVAEQIYDERSSDFIERPTVLGIEKVVNGYVSLRIVAKMNHGKSAETSRELRRRLKIAFDAAGIKGARREP